MDTGRHYLAIPGPSVMPERVLNAMHRGAPNIYSGELVGTVETCLEDLRVLAGAKREPAFYIANGHGIWEAALANVIAEDDEVLVLSNGPFGLGWGEVAQKLGAKVTIENFGLQKAVDPERVAEILKQDTTHRFKAVLVVQVDTGTSLRNDVAAIGEAIKAAGHPALYCVDCIASFGCMPFDMQAWDVDIMVTASQKGLMTPPGIGFVYMSDKARTVRARMKRVSAYWDWEPRLNPDLFYMYFFGTAPTHHIFGLREALDMLKEEGFDAVFRRHELFAKAYWAAIDVWAQGGSIELNVADPKDRSWSVTALRSKAPHATQLREWLEANAGVTLGIGLGMVMPGDPAWHGFFRIGHMGHMNMHMVLGVIGAIDAGLKALDIPHGSGAVEAAARIMSQG